jgi:hypothetical protein
MVSPSAPLCAEPTGVKCSLLGARRGICNRNPLCGRHLSIRPHRKMSILGTQLWSIHELTGQCLSARITKLPLKVRDIFLISSKNTRGGRETIADGKFTSNNTTTTGRENLRLCQATSWMCQEPGHFSVSAKRVCAPGGSQEDSVQTMGLSGLASASSVVGFPPRSRRLPVDEAF